MLQDVDFLWLLLEAQSASEYVSRIQNLSTQDFHLPWPAAGACRLILSSPVMRRYPIILRKCWSAVNAGFDMRLASSLMVNMRSGLSRPGNCQPLNDTIQRPLERVAAKHPQAECLIHMGLSGSSLSQSESQTFPLCFWHQFLALPWFQLVLQQTSSSKTWSSFQLHPTWTNSKKKWFLAAWQELLVEKLWTPTIEQ